MMPMNVAERDLDLTDSRPDAPPSPLTIEETGLPESQILELLLRGRNLTDEEARRHSSFLKNVAPLPGRDVSLSLKFLF